MPIHLTLTDALMRLFLDFLAAGLIGLNRDEHGRPAGFRTNLLVSLAACIAMIQTNLLINSTGKASDSFVVMDIMRLPLGILSGIGFIGAGAILKKGNFVVGVTTAATLWFVTVMGLCFGGGQISLGIAAFVLGLFVLTVLKNVELALPSEHRGELTVRFSEQIAESTEIEILLRNSGLIVVNRFLKYESQEIGRKTVGWSIRWKGRRGTNDPPSIIRELENQSGIQMLEFTVNS